MATYSAYRHVELDKVGCGKRRITKPPGGDTNEIFTTPNSTPPSTPRKVKNYMASNIFTPESAGPVGNVVVEPRSVRHRPDDDSFGRLFGAQGKGDVTDSPRVKNLQKSSIIFTDAGVKNGSANGHTNGTNGTNGHGPSNGHNGATNGHGASNGSSNGHGHENGSGSSTPNGHSNGHGVTNGGSNGVTNGDAPAKTNGTNGINGSNGVNGTNGSHAETNGSNGVSNGKRIPPGGFSSKLW